MKNDGTVCSLRELAVALYVWDNEDICRLSAAMAELAKIISQQVSLEGMVVDFSPDGFESFFNYLPHFIAKPSFKTLKVLRGKVPRNALESMVSVFLSSPTSHAQSLDLSECEVGNVQFSTILNYELVQPIHLCNSGEFKSLNFPACSPLMVFRIVQHSRGAVGQVHVGSQ